MKIYDLSLIKYSQTYSTETLPFQSVVSCPLPMNPISYLTSKQCQPFKSSNVSPINYPIVSIFQLYVNEPQSTVYLIGM